MRQTRGGVCRLRTQIARCAFPKEGSVEKSLRYQARRALLQQTVPQYREASPSQKKTLLDAFVAATGYHRTYARWLLNHAEEVQPTLQRPRPRQYGPDVQHALFLAWHAANRICAKRLIPFLPTLVEALERHEHLHLTEECRSQLLSMSAATADRLLRSQRTLGLRGLSTTRAGTLLKQQIPLRTFEEWKETRPGFLEADLVAHCGADIEGGYVYTLTLTDVATGWTECLPLLHRSQEAVLAALRRARTLFPFPILGIDTDNGGEFINEVLIAYCEQEHISFTQGRPYLKNDQCFVEQKNGAIVRQVVGYDRLVGEHAYRQLTELYRALRLYVNCFQPSMKLLSKQREGKTVRYVYDPAKTPLQRLLLSGALPAQKQQETFPPRRVYLIQQQGSTPCTENRSGENAYWAGGAATKTPLKGSGSKSCPGWLLTLNGAAGTSSGSYSATLQDAINHYKSAPHSSGCVRSEPIFWELWRSSGRKK